MVLHPKIPTCSGPESHDEQTPALKVSLQTRLWFRSRGYEQPPHPETRGATILGWFADDRSSSSDNYLRLGRQDSCGNGLRADAAAERLSPTKDENQPFMPGGRRSGGAGGVSDLVGRETFSDRHHLSTDGGIDLSANTAPVGVGCPKAHRQVLAPVPAMRTRAGPSQNMSTALATYDVLGDPPVRLATTARKRTECCALAGQQQFAFPGMAGGSLLCRAGGWFPPPEAGGRKGSPTHAEATPDAARPPPRQG
jgi:hypothetical protein